MEARNKTVKVIVEHSVLNNDSLKSMKTHVNSICSINGWDAVNDEEVFKICKSLAFSYLQLSFHVQKESVVNRDRASKFNSYARRFPELEAKFVKENA